MKKKKIIKTIEVLNTEKINKITCKGPCGKAKSVRPDILAKRIITYGSLENLLATYECRDCRKRTESTAPTAPKRIKIGGAAGYSAIDEETGKGIYFWQVPGWGGFTKPSPVFPSKSNEHYKIAYGTSCALPALYLDNKKFCDDCPFLETCACILKRTKSGGGVYVNGSDEETNDKPLTYYRRRKLGLLNKKPAKGQEEIVPAMKALPVDIKGLKVEPTKKKLSYHQRKKAGLLKWTRKPKN
jgi:hypothetical protein